jgi:hypothetical protein
MNKDIKRIVFFNHWRNGDSFVNKAYVKQIIESHPGCEYFYAHQHHENIAADLNCRHQPLDVLPQELNWRQMLGFDYVNKTLYVNCWAGVWQNIHFGMDDHPNFDILHRGWSDILTSLNLPVLGDYHYYLPMTDFAFYDCRQADQYLKLRRIRDRKMILFCNGPVMSRQCDLTDMAETVQILSSKYPEYEFLLTYPVNVSAQNVFCTDEIFGSPVGNINQIAYLSQFAELVVGKNSGPFTYSQHRANLNNYQKSFLCYGKRAIDWILGSGEYYCNAYFSATSNEHTVVEQIVHILDNGVKTPQKKSVNVL